ncbi:P-loop containing nucleoside triphosphate hydrolase protein [Hyaloraphidium curvatum]|nr:P-loop containing nucleoside triphosphate hydrolase protein [Hyaloraphidium curvatum]
MASGRPLRRMLATAALVGAAWLAASGPAGRAGPPALQGVASALQGVPEGCPPQRKLGPYPAAVLARLAAPDVAAGDPPLLPLAVASFPRSGTTWMRAVLHAALGWAETSVDDSSALGLADPFVVKTHFPERMGAWERAVPEAARGWGMFARAMHLVRNPFDAIASSIAFDEANADLKRANVSSAERNRRLRLLSRPDAPGRPSISPDSPHFRRHLDGYARHLRYWSAPPRLPSRTERRLLVRYEDLATDPQAALLRIARFVFDPQLRAAASAFLADDLPGNATLWPSPLDHPFFYSSGIDARALFSQFHASRLAFLDTAPATARALLQPDASPLAPSEPQLATALRCAALADAAGGIDTARAGRGARKAGDGVRVFEPGAVGEIVHAVGKERLCGMGYGGLLKEAGYGGLVEGCGG